MFPQTFLRNGEEVGETEKLGSEAGIQTSRAEHLNLMRLCLTSVGALEGQSTQD